MELNIHDYEWDEQKGIASCTLKYKNMEFKGIAQCHPEDIDFKSEITGLLIAEIRASIMVLQFYKNNELQTALNALNQLYYSMNRSKHFNKKDYAVRMLIRQIKQKEADIKTIKTLIEKRKTDMYQFINDKEELYNKLRKNRG